MSVPSLTKSTEVQPAVIVPVGTAVPVLVYSAVLPVLVLIP